MYNRPSDCHQTTMFGDLESMLDQNHPLYVLAKLIHWVLFENEFKKHFAKAMAVWQNRFAEWWV